MAKGSKGMARRILISAGPTREHIDPVRYLTNESSGKMGFEMARAAAERGDEVVLVAGPVHLETPPGVTRIDVVSARDMLRAVREQFKAADVLIMCAAVADWRPKRRLAGKWRKKDGGAEEANIELVKNPDIIATVAKNKGERLVIGFALETGQGLARARKKLQRKNADFVVLNDASALKADRTSVTILGSDGSTRRLENKTKRAVAKVLVALGHP
ncbi:MAG: phosphopantothenoylcysteine decarboxylase/phosphopantothenate--cysteine ligase [Planctomycetota bacterium]|jgi:phosphopantothenoylcysteine decarboxylase/phosphopantothenate--cysteine ligase